MEEQQLLQQQPNAAYTMGEGEAAPGVASGGAGTSNSMEPPLVFPAADVKHFVGGFHSEVTEDNLRSHFSKFGAVADVKIMRDSASGRSRGFGFVTMAEPSSKSRILNEKEHVIGGRKASVRPYTEADLKDSFTDGPILKRKIFVGGVNPALGHDALENYFGKYGPLEDSTIMRYPDGRSRGFGFVVFRDEATCQQVLQQRNHYVTPRDKVEVKPCLSRGKSRPSGMGGGMPDPHYGGGYGMGQMQPYSGGNYGYGAGYGGGSYGGMYGGAGSYGGGYGAGYGSGIPGASWSDYREANSVGSGWGPYDSYGGYYGGWTGVYGGGGPQQQGPYGPATIPRSAAAGVSQPPQGAAGSRTGEVGYYDLGPSSAAGGTATGAVPPMASASLVGSASASHPGYGPIRRVAGLPANPGTVGYGGLGRGRSSPY